MNRHGRMLTPAGPYRVFGGFVRMLRLNQELRQKDIARLFGHMDPVGISNMEQGKLLPRIDKLPVLAEALGVKVEELLTFYSLAKEMNGKKTPCVKA